MEEKDIPKKQEEQEVHKKKKHHNNGKEKKLLEQNQKLLKELEEANDKILRLTAETQNMKRHFEEDKMRLAKYDGESLIMELLPIVDNFERAILADDANLSDDVSKFLSGVKMIYGSLNNALDKIGVKEIECLNKPFDVVTMNAVLIDHESDVDDDIVIDCMQKGYMYKDKVIRPAMVKVNKKDE